jgi:hypothetical protein
MPQEWYYAKGDQKHGPVPAITLKEMATSGQLSPNDLIWKEGMSQWMEAKNIKGLFPIPKTPSTQMPPPLPIPKTPSSFPPPFPTKQAIEGVQPNRTIQKESLLSVTRGLFNNNKEGRTEAIRKFIKHPQVGGIVVALILLIVGIQLCLSLSRSDIVGDWSKDKETAQTQQISIEGQKGAATAADKKPISPIAAAPDKKAATPSQSKTTSTHLADMADGPIHRQELLDQLDITPFTPDGGIDPIETSWKCLADGGFRISGGSMQCSNFLDPKQTVPVTFVHTSDGKIVLIQWSGEWNWRANKLSKKDEYTMKAIFMGLELVFPNNPEVDGHKLILGDNSSLLLTTGVKKTIGRAILNAKLFHNVLTVTVAVDPEQRTRGLTAEMLQNVLNQELRFYHMPQ